MNCYGVELFTTYLYVEYDRLLAQKKYARGGITFLDLLLIISIFLKLQVNLLRHIHTLYKTGRGQIEILSKKKIASNFSMTKNVVTKYLLRNYFHARERTFPRTEKYARYEHGATLLLRKERCPLVPKG